MYCTYLYSNKSLGFVCTEPSWDVPFAHLQQKRLKTKQKNKKFHIDLKKRTSIFSEQKTQVCDSFWNVTMFYLICVSLIYESIIIKLHFKQEQV